MKTSASEIIVQYTAAGELFEKLQDGRVRCRACGHGCLIVEGKTGICKVRFNRDGILRVPFGYVAGIQCDPIEKKPFFHLLPGSGALSFGMIGCNFHCGFCQNWMSSQAPGEERACVYVSTATPKEIVRKALEHGAASVVSTYNEPLITSEWAVAVFKEAKAEGLRTACVSNGFGSPEVLEYLGPWVDAFNIDLKCYSDVGYRQLGGRLEPVLHTIRDLHRKGTWIEIVTLLVPGFNDSGEELEGLVGFLADVGPEIPWHITAFHRNYLWTHGRDTSAEDLLRAAEIGKKAGLRYIYTGNLPGATGDRENTRCPDCGELLVERSGFQVLGCSLTARGDCPACQTPIPGIWGSPDAQGRE
jgi:pyruvate formate lyase activating enzyme